MKSMPKKESKRIVKKLQEHYGFKDKLDYVFYKKDDSVYISSKELKNIEGQKGLLFMKGDVLTIEGSQIIGPGAKKNVLEISSEDKKKWLKGLNLNKIKDVVILKSEEDYLGCTSKGKNSLEKKRMNE